VVLQFHGGTVERLNWRNNRLALAVANGLLGRADAVLVLSEVQGAGLESLFPDLALTHVKNGVPMPALPLEDGHTGLRILYLGRLHADKGVMETIEGFRAAGLSDAELRIAGAGPLCESVKRACQEVPRASFVGCVFGAAKEAQLAWADVMVLVGSHQEGLPYSLLEGASFGLVLIASPNGAVPTVVLDGVNGFLVPPREAASLARKLTLLGSDRRLLATMGQASRKIVEQQFSLAEVTRIFGEIYGRVLGTHETSRSGA
jgi:glycosyltransferase involved in cell wall biosynthesis